MKEDIQHGKGLDIGTVNLIAAEQDSKGAVVIKRQRNAFIEATVDSYTKNLLTHLNVPYVMHDRKIFIIGDSAFELANVLNKNLRRPMKEGLISPKEMDAIPIMRLLIENILGKPRVQNELCYFSVPADPIDKDLNVIYHKEVFNSVLSKLGYTPKPLLEGHAIVLSELADEEFTGIGISCGGGLVNVCVSYKSLPCLSFSTSRAGDWVDNNVATVLGIKPTRATFIKEKGVDLIGPKTREEEAISIYYRSLINYTFTTINEKFQSSENMPTFPDKITVVLAGGSALAGGFLELVKDEVKNIPFPFEIKGIRLAEDALNAVAKGILMASLSE